MCNQAQVMGGPKRGNLSSMAPRATPSMSARTVRHRFRPCGGGTRRPTTAMTENTPRCCRSRASMSCAGSAVWSAAATGRGEVAASVSAFAFACGAISARRKSEANPSRKQPLDSLQASQLYALAKDRFRKGGRCDARQEPRWSTRRRCCGSAGSTGSRSREGAIRGIFCRAGRIRCR